MVATDKVHTKLNPLATKVADQQHENRPGYCIKKTLLLTLES